MTTKAILFLAGPAEDAAPVIAAARAAHSDAAWSVVVRGRDRRWLEQDLQGCTVLDDKPPGGKLAYLLSLRGSAFDVGLTWFSGDSTYDAVKIVAFFAGARRREWVDSAGASGALGLGTVIRQLVRTKGWRWAVATRCVAVMSTVYRNTLGRVLSPILLWWRTRDMRLPRG